MYPVKVGVVVVLYNPTHKVLTELELWLPPRTRLILVDNSPQQSIAPDFITKSPFIIDYIHFPENIGIAEALNIGINTLKKYSCTHALTMDQDSKPPIGMVQNLIHELNEEENWQDIGIISPRHQLEFNIESYDISLRKQIVPLIMTSGNLVQIDCWEKIGKFDQSLFIDCVDDDFCKRLTQAGYRIIQMNELIMLHSLGSIQKRTILGRTYYPTFHNAIRRYYMTRNRLTLLKRYGADDPILRTNIKRNLIRDFFLVLVFEGQKIQKIYFQLKGFIDYLRHKSGKLERL